MSRPLSVGIVCFPSIGGSGVVATDLAAGLSRRGHRVYVAASGPPSRRLPTCERLFFHEVEVSSYPVLEHSPYTLAVASSLVELATEHRLDLIHVHYAVPHATSAYLARQVLGRSAPAILTTLHGTDVTQVGSDPSYLPITRFSVAQSDGISVPSEFLRREAYRRFGLSPDRSIEVIPNFVDTERFVPPETRDRGRFDELFAASECDRADDGGPVLFHVSSFRAVKRATDLIEVLAGVRRHVPARLMLVGDGPERHRVMHRARELDVARSVCLVGVRTDFVDLLKHADAFVLPSESESFGVAALEALSCGVPVVAYRVGGLPELVSPEVGRLVEPFDVGALTEATLELLTEGSLRDALGRAARLRAEALYRLEPAIERYETFYRRVIAAAAREAL